MESWPNYTCVLVFFYHSLLKLNYNYSVYDLAQSLNIRVPTEERNPFNFKYALNIEELGIKSREAEFQINEFLIKKCLPIRLRYIPFNSIPYKMYDNLLVRLLKEDLIIGFGYNYANCKETNEEIIKHVSFINSFKNDVVEVMDYYIDRKGISWEISYELFVKIVSEVNDGYWVIGPDIKLNFQLV